MATVTRENIGTLHDKLTVKLVKDDYMPAFEKTLKQYAKTANVPGFRKGMVPAGMLRKMYGQSVFNEEVIRSAGKKLEDYMTSEKLSIFAQPMILPNENMAKLDMNKPDDIDFSFEIGLKPEFDIPAIKNKAALTRYKISVTDKMMDDEIERIKRRYGKVESQESASDKEDIIYATYEPCDEAGNVTDPDLPAGQAGKKIEDTEVLDKMPAKLKAMVMGKKAGDSMVFRPADVCTEDELKAFLKDPLKSGEEAAQQHYKLTVSKVGKLIPQELGPELYAQVFQHIEVKDETDFREKVKVELQREFDRITGERLHNEIFEMLVHNTPISLPAAFLKRWMREGGEKPKSAQEVEQEYGGFEHQLIWQLISDKLMHDNGISVSMEDVKKDIKTRVLAYFGLGADDEGQAPWMESYMAKVMKDEKMIDETYHRMVTAKLFSFLEMQFTIGEKEIEEEAFFKLADAHAAHHHHH